jgi:hypothetical protein
VHPQTLSDLLCGPSDIAVEKGINIPSQTPLILICDEGVEYLVFAVF